MAEPKITMYDAPRTLLLVANHPGAYPYKSENCIGETSRSYVYREFEWGPSGRWAKKDYRVFTEDEYNELVWASMIRYELSKAVENCYDPAILRQIAALVGYKEKPNA